MATGETTIGVHRRLVHLAHSTALDFSGVQFFNVDEYVGLPPSHPLSVGSRMQAQVFSPLGIAPAQAHIPNGNAADPGRECEDFEQLIEQCGGIDLQVLGIGLNGHIGFNEPGTPFNSLTHVADIAQETRESKAHAFGSLSRVPSQGITMGIVTIMRAGKILLLARGAHKAAIIARALQGHASREVPASALQNHSSMTVVLDEAAASMVVTVQG
jgi:glucosamine-6-phosphate deaminase